MKFSPLYIYHGDTEAWNAATDRVIPGEFCVVTGPNSGPPANAQERSDLDPHIQEIRRRKAVPMGYIDFANNNLSVRDLFYEMDLPLLVRFINMR